jgi:hypothetical protein
LNPEVTQPLLARRAQRQLPVDLLDARKSRVIRPITVNAHNGSISIAAQAKPLLNAPPSGHDVSTLKQPVSLGSTSPNGA